MCSYKTVLINFVVHVIFIKLELQILKLAGSQLVYVLTARLVRAHLDFGTSCGQTQWFLRGPSYKYLGTAICIRDNNAWNKCKKNEVYKNGYRRRSCTSKTAKIHRFVRFVMYCSITTVPVAFYWACNGCTWNFGSTGRLPLEQIRRFWTDNRS